jgi:hypothetical protein
LRPSPWYQFGDRENLAGQPVRMVVPFPAGSAGDIAAPDTVAALDVRG